MDEMQSLAWANLSFYAGDSPPATFEGRPTVIRSGARPAASPAILPSESITTPEGVAYTVTTNITWVDDTADGVAPADAQPSDYKRVTVILSWQARGATRTQRFDTNRSLPRDKGVATDPFDITANVLSPDPVVLNASKHPWRASSIRPSHLSSCRLASAVRPPASCCSTARGESPPGPRPRR